MPGQGPNWTEYLSCAVCCRIYSESTNRPISLGCGHTVCKLCLSQLQQSKCPFDQSPITCDIDKLPVNYALLQLIGAAIPDKVIDEEQTVGDISDAKKTECYESARKCIEELAVYLKPLSEDSINELEKNNENLAELKISKQNYQQPFLQARNGRTVSTPPLHNAGCVLSRPMQRKLLVLINCQLVEEEGRSRAARAARSLGERSVTELILAHQNPQQLSANLWSMVRTRGCQFLGPGMQEEVLRLILLALEDGSALSRKVLVLFVVQRLEKQYPQASKTAIGHVVQLLYRASCFKVTKREEESSLMQLKEEFRTYDALRQEHDAQIVDIAMEAGLRISPEQWSSLLYGDALHKSHMQSIIDKHQSPQSFSQGINELVLVLKRLGDPCNLCRLRPHLEFLAKIDPSPDCPAPPWDDLEVVMKSLKIVVQGLVDFVKRFNNRRPEMAPPQNTRYKTSLCRDFTAKGSCPRGATCTFAHSQEELEQYRCRSKKMNQKGGMGGLPLSTLNGRLGAETLQAEDLDQQLKFGATSHSSADAGECDESVHALSSSLTSLSVRPAIPSSTQPESGLAPELSHWPLGAPAGQQGQGWCPPTMFPVQPAVPIAHRAMRVPFGSASQSEGLQTEQQPAAFPKGMSVRLQPPSDCKVPYQNTTLNPNLSQPLTPANLSQKLPSSNLAQQLPPANLSQPLPPANLSQQLPPGTPANLHQVNIPPLPPPGILPGMVPQAAACLHHQMTGDTLASATGSVYPMGQMMTGVMPPPFPPVYGQGPEVQAAMTGGVPMSSMQTLEKLQNRKSKLISCLQSECSGPKDASVAGNDFDRVLLSLPQLRSSPLTNSVNDSLVATRTTNTLDELESGNRNQYQVNRDQLKGNSFAAGLPSTVPAYQSATNIDSGSNRYGSPSVHHTHYQNYDQNPHYLQPTVKQVSGKVTNEYTGNCASLSDMAGDEQSIFREVMIRLPLDEEDDFFIPFDPPLVSKFGPISRCARIKSRNTAPVQVTAVDSSIASIQCTPVLSNTPLCHPFPAPPPEPSSYKQQMNTCGAPIVMPTKLAPPAPAMYSPWSGLDFWRWKIPAMVQQLETSAIQAHTTSERLTLQLQSVELQISLKTGENPKHVSQLLQEAKPGEGDQKDSQKSAEKLNI